jgi:alpha-methylacyl-CoA racemase
MGPLHGIKVVELAGIGPGPHACAILADLGADVIRIDRPGGQMMMTGPHDLLTRNRPSVALNLKDPAAVETVLQLVESADVIIEGLRPGVTERLGLGPDAVLARNPKIVYGRMTGWGQEGPLSQAAGHDLTYIATTGVLSQLGQAEKPQFPINLLGDFGGGSTYLVIGILLHAKASGEGQVVDAAIIDGTAHLDLMASGLRAMGLASQPRGHNMLDGGAPYYAIYPTSDDRHVAVGALEPQFFAVLVETLGVKDTCPTQYEFARYEEMREVFATTFASRTMAEWAEIFEGTDACVAPVLTPAEAAEHPHLKARAAYIEVNGVVQPAPAPRTIPATPTPPALVAGADTTTALAAWGIDPEPLLATGAAVQPE